MEARKVLLINIVILFCLTILLSLSVAYWCVRDYKNREAGIGFVEVSDDDVEMTSLSTNETPLPPLPHVLQNPFLRPNWVKMNWEVDPKTGNILIPYYRPTYHFPRPISVYTESVSFGLNSVPRNDADDAGTIVTRGFVRSTYPREAHAHSGELDDPNHPNDIPSNEMAHLAPGSRDVDHKATRRRVIRSVVMHSTEPVNMHKRVKKGSAVYPGPFPPQGAPQHPQPMLGPNYGMAPSQQQPPQPQFPPQQRRPMSPPPPPMMPPSPAPPMLPQVGTAPRQQGGLQMAQRPIGSTIFDRYYSNPNDIIKTANEPFHIHMPIVSAVPQPFPNMEEMLIIARQYKNPLDEEALWPEEKRRPDVPDFLLPYVIPGKRSTRNMEKSLEKAKSLTEDNPQPMPDLPKSLPEFSKSDGDSVEIENSNNDANNNNEIMENMDEALEEQDRLMFLSRIEEQLKLLAQGTNPAKLLRKRRSNSDDTLVALSRENNNILKRSKRGFFRWIKNLFHKKQPEPEPIEDDFSAPAPQLPRHPNNRQQSRDREEQTTHRSRPPPEVIGYPEGSPAKTIPKSVVVHERPVYIPRSTTIPSNRIIANLPQEPDRPVPGTEPHRNINAPSEPELLNHPPTDHQNYENAEKEKDQVDKLLPVPMRSTHILHSSGVRQTSLNYEESPKHHTESADAEEEEPDIGRDKRSLKEDVNLNYAPNARPSNPPLVITSLSKQEMTLLQELFLTIVSRKCQVNRVQLNQVGASIQSIVQQSRLPAIPFSIKGDPLAVQLVQQLMACRALIPRSPLEIMGYNPYRLTYLNPNTAIQFQPVFGNNRLGNDVDEGDPVTRTKRGKRSTPDVVSFPVIRLPAQLANLIRVQFLVIQVVQQSCSSVVDPNLVKLVGDLILKTIDGACREKRCYSTQEQTMSLESELYFCPKRTFQQGPVVSRSPVQPYMPNMSPYVFH